MPTWIPCAGHSWFHYYCDMHPTRTNWTTPSQTLLSLLLCECQSKSCLTKNDMRNKPPTILCMLLQVKKEAFSFSYTRDKYWCACSSSMSDILVLRPLLLYVLKFQYSFHITQPETSSHLVADGVLISSQDISNKSGSWWMSNGSKVRWAVIFRGSLVSRFCCNAWYLNAKKSEP